MEYMCYMDQVKFIKIGSIIRGKKIYIRNIETLIQHLFFKLETQK
jgi:hypothetical protein